MQDYNAMFGTQYTMEQLGAYNSNINDRLARKKKIYQVRENQLDIVIVVDRLLTGFDAPCLSTLFIDRKPMRSYGIIQAFSRTNRLYDNQKRFGQIVIFQMPAHFKRAVDDAMRLYSSGGGNYVQAPSWEVAEARFKKAIRNLRQAAPTPEAIDTMSKAEKLRFLKAYREFDDAYSDVQVYSPYQVKELPKDYLIDAPTIEAYSGKFNNVKEEFRKDPDDDDPDVNLVIDYDLRCYHMDQIDEDYILRLMEATRSDESAFIFEDSGKNQKIIEEINEEILRFRKTNPARAKILDDMWHEYQDKPRNFVNQNFVDALHERIDSRIKGLIDEFASEWCINPEALEFFVETYDVTKDPSEKQDNQDALKKAAHPKEYRKDHPHIGLKYWPKLLDSLREFYVQHLQKLLER
jgi:type I restriction enzyme R subunit